MSSKSRKATKESQAFQELKSWSKELEISGVRAEKPRPSKYGGPTNGLLVYHPAERWEGWPLHIEYICGRWVVFFSLTRKELFAKRFTTVQRIVRGWLDREPD
jgi:hypothetical protein